MELGFDEVWKRIEEVTGWRTYGQLADFLQIKAPSISGAKKKGLMPLEWAYRVAQAHGASTDWIATGAGFVRRDDHPATAPTADYHLVPRYEVAASAGGGSVVRSEQIVDFLAFKIEWLKNILGVSPQNAVVISVIGDSMEPHLGDGDLILVDISFKKIVNDSVYVLQYGDSLMVKRLQRKLDGTIIIKSDNKSYEPEEVRGEATEQLRIVGRMVRRVVR